MTRFAYGVCVALVAGHAMLPSGLNSQNWVPEYTVENYAGCYRILVGPWIIDGVVVGHEPRVPIDSIVQLTRKPMGAIRTSEGSSETYQVLSLAGQGSYERADWALLEGGESISVRWEIPGRNWLAAALSFYGESLPSGGERLVGEVYEVAYNPFERFLDDFGAFPRTIMTLIPVSCADIGALPGVD